jgi:hypothetical protein
LEEVAKLGRVRAVVVHHPYYADFITPWAQRVIQGDHPGRGFGGSAELSSWSEVELSFTPQRGPYSDVTSVLNADDILSHPDELYIAYADNLYPQYDPLLRLRLTEPGTSVLVRPYRREEAAYRGVLVTEDGAVCPLVEKPDTATAQELEHRFGTQRLALLAGRMRADRAFLDFLHNYAGSRATEPKLALALAAHARTHPVRVYPTNSPVTDLGAPLNNARNL